MNRDGYGGNPRSGGSSSSSSDGKMSPGQIPRLKTRLTGHQRFCFPTARASEKLAHVVEIKTPLVPPDRSGLLGSTVLFHKNTYLLGEEDGRFFWQPIPLFHGCLLSADILLIFVISRFHSGHRSSRDRHRRFRHCHSILHVEGLPMDAPLGSLGLVITINNGN